MARQRVTRSSNVPDEALQQLDMPPKSPSRAASRRSGPAGSWRQALTSPTQQQVLALALFTIWLLPVLGGVFLNEGTQTHAELDDDKVSLPLDSFDWLLRHGGALLPLLPLGLRLASQARPFQNGQGTEVVLYIGLALVRILVYSLHVSAAFEWLVNHGAVSAVPVQYMSDHVFLGGSLIAVLACEILLGTAALDAVSQPTRRWTASSGVVLATVMYLLVSGDMFYTARYFHEEWESILAALCSASFFMLPAATFCLQTPRTGLTRRSVLTS